MDIVGLQYISYITTKEMGVLRVITVTENIQRAINALENSAPVITARCNRDSLLDMQFKRINLDFQNKIRKRILDRLVH